MIAIKGMEMPERCEKCKFCINERTNDYGSFGECLLQKNKKVNCLVWRRDDSCPLVEIVTCKDCKYWKDSDGVYRRGWGVESKCPINTKEVYEGHFYCKDGIRKSED